MRRKNDFRTHKKIIRVGKCNEIIRKKLKRCFMSSTMFDGEKISLKQKAHFLVSFSSPCEYKIHINRSFLDRARTGVCKTLHLFCSSFLFWPFFIRKTQRKKNVKKQRSGSENVLKKSECERVYWTVIARKDKKMQKSKVQGTQKWKV